MNAAGKCTSYAVLPLGRGSGLMLISFSVYKGFPTDTVVVGMLASGTKRNPSLRVGHKNNVPVALGNTDISHGSCPVGDWSTAALCLANTVRWQPRVYIFLEARELRVAGLHSTSHSFCWFRTTFVLRGFNFRRRRPFVGTFKTLMRTDRTHLRSMVVTLPSGVR